jgi:hypothetical protein
MPSQRHSLSAFDKVCESCGALHWIEERTDASSIARPQYSSCCERGIISLPSFEDPPEPLYSLLAAPQSKPSTELNAELDHESFHANIRNYNNALAFTSLRVAVDHSVWGPKGIHTFRISGELCHRIGSLLPPPEGVPAFAQIYIYDSDPQHQLDIRMSHQHQVLDRDTLHDLQGMIVKYNPYYAAFMSAKERLAQYNHIQLQLKTICEPTADQRRYNRPTASEIAVLIPGTGEERTHTRDIVVQDRSGPLRRVSEMHSSYYLSRMGV